MLRNLFNAVAAGKTIRAALVAAGLAFTAASGVMITSDAAVARPGHGHGHGHGHGYGHGHGHGPHWGHRHPGWRHGSYYGPRYGYWRGPRCVMRQHVTPWGEIIWRRRCY